MQWVYAYLVKTRHIGRELVSFFAKQTLLYESCEKSKDGTKEYHNAVFVGLDENGTPRHAHKHGICTLGQAFKGMWMAAILATTFTGLEKAMRCVFEVAKRL
nr:DUF3991 domain-containing protein [Oscillibacter sp.]